MIRFERGQADHYLHDETYKEERQLPWVICNQTLVTGSDREDSVVRDPHTRQMRLWKKIRGTNSSDDDVPDLDVELRDSIINFQSEDFQVNREGTYEDSSSEFESEMEHQRWLRQPQL